MNENFENPGISADISHVFLEHSQLASKLLPFAIDKNSNDGSHDFSHITRVWSNAKKIYDIEGGDLEIIVASVILHDCYAVEKSSPLRNKASSLASERAKNILHGIGWSENRCSLVAHAVQAHSFSAEVEPQTLEACILQDADRLDAIGFVGVARCFYTAGRMGSHLYNISDPKGRTRELQDKYYALDHFPEKLLRLSENFRTRHGARMARERHEKLVYFLNEFLLEVSHEERLGNWCLSTSPDHLNEVCSYVARSTRRSQTSCASVPPKRPTGASLVTGRSSGRPSTLSVTIDVRSP